MMIVRKIHNSTTSAIGLTVKPVRSASSSLIVGRSVTVKIVASTAHQTISRTRAHETTGRGEGSCIGRVKGTKAAAKPLSSAPCSWRGGRVAEGGGLLNRYRALKPYRGFESPLLRARFARMINVQ